MGLDGGLCQNITTMSYLTLKGVYPSRQSPSITL
nr:MAG TPA: hypothetical protein [Caudoviricetes sp.]